MATPEDDVVERRSIATLLQLPPSEDRLFGPNPSVSLNATYYEGQRSAYGRHTNPTWEAFEALIGELEGGTAVAFGSGAAATFALLLALGPRALVVADSYMGTRQLARWLGARIPGIELVEPSDLDAHLDRLAPGSVVLIETPSNPLLVTYPIATLAKRIHERGGLLAVDSTLATPVLQRPLTLGADVVVHSASKFLSGHSDVLGGVLVASDEDLVARVGEVRELTGAIIGPVEAYLCFRGLRTLAVRVERASATATTLAMRLRDRLGDTVRYPGFDSELVGPGRQQSAGGALVALELESAQQADAMLDGLSLFHHATSLGGVESLAERRGRYPGEDRIGEGLVRLSVGLEDVEDLWGDLDRALTRAGL
ncbi:trans-sulfuration enzyme family protein [Acidimicrobium ferrooxidans]|uniref:trans-sulfuration enzyme family protein n=1 Tax=Acidimicrobium ferrooxidans TaxID=53635 RepID=UPI00067461A9|nr:PLP-dependent aspartate aminotransferase family protein [Acidimicrobium ferrooxidans]